MSTEGAEAAQAAQASSADIPVPIDLQDMEGRIMEGVRKLLQDAGLSSSSTTAPPPATINGAEGGAVGNGTAEADTAWQQPDSWRNTWQNWSSSWQSSAWRDSNWKSLDHFQPLDRPYLSHIKFPEYDGSAGTFRKFEYDVQKSQGTVRTQ